MLGQSIANDTENNGSTIHFSKVCMFGVVCKVSKQFNSGLVFEFYVVSLCIGDS